ncbi:MAG TPA: DUF5666 domain-containing protein [Anaerolineales bacterium]|nr:DUF5666 domain-containing protein [Anaerolineales bacterium]
MEAEQILQARLERLEAGEAVDKIIAGLPEEESELLYLAAQIRTIPKPARNPVIVQAQYRKVVQAAKQTRAPSPLQFALKWLVPVGMALVLFAALAGIWGGINWLSNRNTAPEQIASSGGDLTKTPETVPTQAGGTTPTAEQIPTPNKSTGPQIATLQGVHGIVQVQNPDGSWATIQTAEVKAGQTFRTWSLSSAQLFFFDGSVVSLGANTSVEIESLNAQQDGPRLITLFQPYGETSHSVAPSLAENSSYIVHTPSATGEAKGTTFQVSVIADEGSSFAVVEGEVAVTGQQTTVDLTPGQITSIENNEDPSEPAFWVNAQGEVTQTGEVWIIGGVPYQTRAGTAFFGNPDIGDLVSVRGQLLTDGSRMADRIEILSQSFVNQFKIMGIVEAMGVMRWTVTGQEIQINDATQIDEGIEVGDQVLVRGVVQEGGALLTTDINSFQNETHFEFTGLVEQIKGSIWVISGKAIATNQETKISGDPEVGDLVQVKGRILPDGTWLAREIEKVIETDHFEFIGIVGSMNPWVVDGISLEVSKLTQKSSGIEIGSRVHVEGVVREDGTWLASAIQLLDEQTQLLIFVGIVDDVDPWVVNGIELDVTDTDRIGNIVEGSLVRVYVQIQEDDAWLVERIELIETDHFNGCIIFRDVVVAVSDEEITLQNGMDIPREVAEIFGNLDEGSESGVPVIVILCFRPNQEIIYARITVIDIESEPPPEPITEGKVTICHIPSGDPSKANTITVDESALAAHLAHGDSLGACDGSEGQNNDTQIDDKGDKKNDKNDKNNKGNKDK